MNKPFRDETTDKTSIEIKSQTDASSEESAAQNPEENQARAACENSSQTVSEAAFQNHKNDATELRSHSQSGSPAQLEQLPPPPPIIASGPARLQAQPLILKKPARALPFTLLMVSFLPILIAFCMLPVNPTALPLLKAALFEHTFQDKISDLTRAYESHHDLEILRERARAYGQAYHWKEAKEDLRTLAARDVQDPSVYAVLANDLLAESAPTPESQALLKKAVLLELSRERLPHLSFFNNESEIYQGMYRLLASGDSQGVLEVSATLTQDRIIGTDLQFFKAAALRELGRKEESKALFASLTRTPDTDTKDSEPSYFEGLTQLDDSNTAAAEAAIGRGAKLPRFRQNKHLCDLTKAFLLYQKGKYAEAFKQTRDTVVLKDKHDEDFTWRSERAAMSLLRAHTLLQLNDKEKAQTEFHHYLSYGATGKIFIPKVYRAWITDLPH